MNSSASSNNNNNIQKTTVMESLVQLLDAQYEHLVDYCNAQTTLKNVVTTPSASHHTMDRITTSTEMMNVASAVQSLQTCVSRVQMDLKSLENVLLLDDSDDDKHKLILDRVVVLAWTDHVERSRRILATIHASTSFAPHGVPTVVNTAVGDVGDNDDVLDTKTVALSTLRASIHQVQEILNHRM